MARHVMTARRRAALRKAQLASARKRKSSVRKKRMVKAGVLAAVGGLAVARHMVTGSRFNAGYKKGPKGHDARHNPLREYLGFNEATNEPITRPARRHKRFSYVTDEYYPGVMRGIVLRGGRHTAYIHYTHVKTYADRYMHQTARKDKAYIKSQNKTNRQFKKLTKGL